MNGSLLRRFFVVLISCLAALSAVATQEATPPLKWACDPEGTPPYPYYNPNEPQKIIGFEVDFVQALARKLGRQPILEVHDWDTIIPGLDRKLYDIVVNGMVISPEKEESVEFSKPYFITAAKLIVRSDDSNITSLAGCNHKVVGIFKSPEIRQLIANMPNVQVREYENETNAFTDLRKGRLDAILMDEVVSVYATAMHTDLKTVGEPIGYMEYAVVMRKADTQLLKQVNQAIQDLIRSGELRQILDSWNIWNPQMAQYCQDFTPSQVPANDFHYTVDSFKHHLSEQTNWPKRYLSFLPILAQSAWITLKISLLAMILATVAGFIMAIARVYGPWPLRFLSSTFIEFIRGTPLLIQLLFIYYGLANIGINLSPVTAGVLGLGINYTAFEAENYRAGLMAVPKGQLEAARALGMSHFQGLRYVVIPQAFTMVIPPVTNDFISLLKDSSLVSVITIVELTKTYTTLAFTYYDFFGIGLLVAFIYLLIGLPFVRFARWAEKRLDTTQKRYKPIVST